MLRWIGERVLSYNLTMADCVFCKITAKELPAFVIYEDDKFLAFLDHCQIVDGHSLLIPKEHVRWVWDIEEIGKFFAVAKKIAGKMQKASGDAWVTSVTLGYLPHAHLHLMPRNSQGNLEMVLKAWSEARAKRQLTGERMEEIKNKFSLLAES